MVVANPLTRAMRLPLPLDINVDIQEFIAQNTAADEMDLPVTSLLNPTLKGRVDVKLHHNKSWRDYLFVFLEDQRRIYYYEKENVSDGNNGPLSDTLVRLMVSKDISSALTYDH
jgi:hypothetical protein